MKSAAHVWLASANEHGFAECLDALPVGTEAKWKIATVASQIGHDCYLSGFRAGTSFAVPAVLRIVWFVGTLASGFGIAWTLAKIGVLP